MIWHDRAPAAPVPALSNRRPECAGGTRAERCEYGDTRLSAARTFSLPPAKCPESRTLPPRMRRAAEWP